MTNPEHRAWLVCLFLSACSSPTPVGRQDSREAWDVPGPVDVVPDVALPLDSFDPGPTDPGPLDVPADVPVEGTCADPGSPPNHAFPEPGPVKALLASLVSLNQGWRFAPDPAGSGESLGWHLPGFDDSAWTTLSAVAPWEAQGFPGHDGLGWYRHEVSIPADWQGSAVRLESFGVDDDYDVWVNRTRLPRSSRPRLAKWKMRTGVRCHAISRVGTRTAARHGRSDLYL